MVPMVTCWPALSALTYALAALARMRAWIFLLASSFAGGAALGAALRLGEMRLGEMMSSSSGAPTTARATCPPCSSAISSRRSSSMASCNQPQSVVLSGTQRGQP
jgi:hypothetical protein